MKSRSPATSWLALKFVIQDLHPGGVGGRVIILDQHGAHKRILYEKLLQNIRGTPTTLPVPTVVRLPDDLAPEV